MTESWATRHKQALLVAASCIVFAVLLLYPIFKEPEKQNCLALLVFASLLWCTEAIPLFVTSMLVPFLIVVLRVLDDTEQEPPARLTPKQAAPAVFHTMFSQVRAVWLLDCLRDVPGCDRLRLLGWSCGCWDAWGTCTGVTVCVCWTESVCVCWAGPAQGRCCLIEVESRAHALKSLDVRGWQSPRRQAGRLRRAVVSRQ